MKTYTCIIRDPEAPHRDREYTVASSSALKCAKVLGQQKDGENVWVCAGRRMLSHVKWDAKAGRYIRAEVRNPLTAYLPAAQRILVYDHPYTWIDTPGGFRGTFDGIQVKTITWAEMLALEGPAIASLVEETEVHARSEKVTWYTCKYDQYVCWVFVPHSWKGVK